MLATKGLSSRNNAQVKIDLPHICKTSVGRYLSERKFDFDCYASKNYWAARNDGNVLYTATMITNETLQIEAAPLNQDELPEAAARELERLADSVRKEFLKE